MYLKFGINVMPGPFLHISVFVSRNDQKSLLLICPPVSQYLDLNCQSDVTRQSTLSGCRDANLSLNFSILNFGDSVTDGRFQLLKPQFIPIALRSSVSVGSCTCT